MAPQLLRRRRTFYSGTWLIVYAGALQITTLTLVAWIVLRPPPEPPLQSFHRQMRDHLTRLDRNLSDGATLFFGSSSVQGLPVHEIAPSAVNFGVGGERISDLSERIKDYRSLASARLVVLAIGYNDLVEVRHETALRRYIELLSRIPGGTPLIISGVQKGLFNVNPRETEAFNSGLRELCLRRGRCVYIDLSTEIDLEDDSDAYYEGDGVHLSLAGYTVWKNLIRNAVRSLTDWMGTQ